jgi:hypothetical protein
MELLSMDLPFALRDRPFLATRQSLFDGQFIELKIPAADPTLVASTRILA